MTPQEFLELLQSLVEQGMEPDAPLSENLHLIATAMTLEA